MKGKVKIGAFPLSQTKLFLLFFALIGVVPLFIHMQWLTGPLVNAILILACLTIGFRSALILAFVPSVAALSTGLLPFVLAPMVSFIVMGNVMFVFVFHLFEKENYFLRLTLAAFLKFAFLFAVARVVAEYFLTDIFVSKLMIMMSWPQFVTAMLGGFIAFSVLKISQNNGKYSLK